MRAPRRLSQHVAPLQSELMTLPVAGGLEERRRLADSVSPARGCITQEQPSPKVLPGRVASHHGQGLHPSRHESSVPSACPCFGRPPLNDAQSCAIEYPA
jgi:hypothetical protein